MTRVVLAYSGALADSLAIPWLAERSGAEVVAVTMDLGQPKEVLEEVRDRALATGKAHLDWAALADIAARHAGLQRAK